METFAFPKSHPSRQQVGGLAAMSAVGLLNGLGGRRQFVLSVLFSMVISMTIFLVLDLDRPQRGLIRLSHESLLRLHESFGKGDGLAP